MIVVPDDFWGEVPKALLLLKPRESATAEEIIEHCPSKIPDFKLPKSVDFGTELPKGARARF